MTPLLEVEGLSATFTSGRLPRRTVRAVHDVSFSVGAGETYGLVGESGCGKTTTGRAILRLTPASGGRVMFEGEDVLGLPATAVRRVRRQVQMVFQDPYSSLNPRMRVGTMLEEPLAIHGTVPRRERTERVLTALGQVGLAVEHLYRYPHEFSGGQRQRIGLARALVTDPRLVICDEPVSALDVSTQSQVLNLMRDLQDRLGLGYLFISHDMSVVRHVSDRVGVMYLGRLVEEAPARELFAEPLHPYTEALLAAVPRPRVTGRRDRAVLAGETARSGVADTGCVFAARCPKVMARCRTEVPAPVRVNGDRWAACHLLG